MTPDIPLRSPTTPHAPSLSRLTSSSSLNSSADRDPTLVTRTLSSSVAKVGPSGDPALAKKRARNLLRDYYGLGGDASAAGVEGKGKGKERAEGRGGGDIDSPNFDAQGFVDKVIAEEGVRGLLVRCNSLVGEIRHLDGERQSLVYNHHHELVEASGTIGKMKASAETLDASLDALQTSFSQISSLTSSLAHPTPPHPLPPNSAAYAPLTHLPPLLSLPTLLSSLSTTKQRSEADRLWGVWEPALRSWEEAGVTSVKEVGDECREVLKKAKRESVGATAGVAVLSSA